MMATTTTVVREGGRNDPRRRLVPASTSITSSVRSAFPRCSKSKFPNAMAVQKRIATIDRMMKGTKKSPRLWCGSVLLSFHV